MHPISAVLIFLLYCEIYVWNIGISSSVKIGAACSSKHSLCDDLNVLNKPIWYYNWGPNSTFSSCNSLPSQQFVPMIWGYKNETTYPVNYIASNTSYILGFNEPNHKKQSNLTPLQAVQGWKVIQSVWGSTHKLVSPSAAPCNNNTGNCTPKYPDPISWFTEFFKICNNECKIDYLATHKYGCNATDNMQYLQNLAQLFGLKIWLTEFSCGTGDVKTVQEQENYMKQFIPMLEKSDFIYRYSWFVVRENGTNSLLKYDDTNSELTELGIQYNTY